MKKMSLFMVLAIVLVAGVARADIVAQYQFEGNFNDGSGNGHTGTGMNGATTIGGELVLDGVDDYVSVADSADFHPATTFTITAWIKPNSLGDNNPIVNKYTVGPRTGYLFRVNSSGTLTISGCKYDQQRSVTSTDPCVVEVDVWTHVAVTFESFSPTWAGSTAWLYINGKEVGTGTMWAPFTTNTEPFLIGAYQTGDSSTHRYFDGSMDDVRFYDHTMSAEEVAEALEPVTTPQVDAGPFRSLLWPGSAVTLQMDATVTDNDNPDQLTYTWSQISGPTVTFVEPCNVEDPCVTFPDMDTYVLRLTAYDGLDAVSDNVTITVEEATCDDVIAGSLLMTGDISGPADVPDCYVDLYDFAALAGNWLRCSDL